MQFRSILKYGYLYSFDKSSFGAIRGCATRLNQDNQSISAGEFYKNTILGVAFNQPSDDGHARWIDQERYLNNASFSNVCTSLDKRFPSNKDTLLIGSSSDGNLLLDSLGSIINSNVDLKIESFGEESYAKIISLVETVERCYLTTGTQVLIIEIGSGYGYWINKAGMILNKKGIPFFVISFDLFLFNCINTRRMAKYFGISEFMMSIQCDIHLFDWDRFAADFPCFSSCPIVLHSSCVIDPYISNECCLNIFTTLSRYNLWGGCHYEGDGFLVMNPTQKSIYLEACANASASSNTVYTPQPFCGMRKIVKLHRNIHDFSYLDPNYLPSLSYALSELTHDIDITKTVTFLGKFLVNLDSSYRLECKELALKMF